MKKIFFVLTIIFLVAALIGWFKLKTQKPSSPMQLDQELVQEPVDFTASFEIYTHGTKRIFTAAMYHQQSPDVFIGNPDPSVVHVKSASITWADFFQTLPMELTKTCLITGTGQTFCTDEVNTLRFFINDEEVQDALDQPIMAGDVLKVTY